MGNKEYFYSWCNLVRKNSIKLYPRRDTASFKTPLDLLSLDPHSFNYRT